MEILSKSLEETEKFVVEFIKQLAPLASEALAKEAATFVGLHGDLGSGKTTFVQLVAKNLGIKDSITSPTFVIMKSYPIPSSKLPALSSKLLVHIDAYRLESGGELLKLGWNEMIADSKNLILLEWPERVSEILPKNYTRLDFEFVDDTTRKISVVF